MSGNRLPFVAGGIGRILSPASAGLGSVADHARAWRQLRVDGAKFCEVLVASESARSRAILG